VRTYGSGPRLTQRASTIGTLVSTRRGYDALAVRVRQLHAVFAWLGVGSTVLAGPLFDRLLVGRAHLDVVTHECAHANLQPRDGQAVGAMQNEVARARVAIAVQDVTVGPGANPVEVGLVIVSKHNESATHRGIGPRNALHPLMTAVQASKHTPAVLQHLNEVHVERIILGATHEWHGLDLSPRCSDRQAHRASIDSGHHKR